MMKITFPHQIDVVRSEDKVVFYVPVKFDLDQNQSRTISGCRVDNFREGDGEERPIEYESTSKLFDKSGDGDFSEIGLPLMLNNAVNSFWVRLQAKNMNTLPKPQQFKLQLVLTMGSGVDIDHDIVFTAQDSNSIATIEDFHRPENLITWANLSTFLIALFTLVGWNTFYNSDVHAASFPDHSDIKLFVGLLIGFVGLNSIRWILGLLSNLGSFMSFYKYPEFYLDQSFIELLRSKKTVLIIMPALLLSLVFIYFRLSFALPVSGLDRDNFSFYDVSDMNAPVVIDALRVYKSDFDKVKIAFDELLLKGAEPRLFVGQLEKSARLPAQGNVKPAFYAFSIKGMRHFVEHPPVKLDELVKKEKEAKLHHYDEEFLKYARGEQNTPGIEVIRSDTTEYAYTILQKSRFDTEALDDLIAREFTHWTGNATPSDYHNAVTNSDSRLSTFQDKFKDLGTATREVFVTYYDNIQPNKVDSLSRYTARTVVPELILLGYLFSNLSPVQSPEAEQFSEGEFSSLIDKAIRNFQEYYRGVPDLNSLNKRISRVYLRFLFQIAKAFDSSSASIHKAIAGVLDKQGREMYLLYLDECLRFDMFDEQKAYFEAKLVENRAFNQSSENLLSIKTELEKFARRYPNPALTGFVDRLASRILSAGK